MDTQEGWGTGDHQHTDGQAVWDLQDGDRSKLPPSAMLSDLPLYVIGGIGSSLHLTLGALI